MEHDLQQVDVLDQWNSGLANLPYEVLEHIFKDCNLEHVDIKNLSFTCHKFRDVGHSNGVWKCKFEQRY